MQLWDARRILLRAVASALASASAALLQRQLYHYILPLRQHPLPPPGRQASPARGKPGPQYYWPVSRIKDRHGPATKYVLTSHGADILLVAVGIPTEPDGGCKWHATEKLLTPGTFKVVHSVP